MARRVPVLVLGTLTLFVLATACDEIPVQPAIQGPSASLSAPVATVSRIDLGTLGGVYGYATDINDLGTVVGWSANAAGVDRAFRWTLGQGMTDLGTLPGDDWSRAVSITNTGQILGVSGRTGNTHGGPVVWAPSGAARPLPIPLPSGGTFMALGDRNASGQVTGTAFGGAISTDHAWVWSPSRGIHDLTGDLPAGTFESYSGDINALGVVVGTYHALVCSGPGVPTECWRGFLWNARTGSRDLGVPAGDPINAAQVRALGLNDLGVVVGYASVGGADFHPVQPYRWTDRTGFTVLPTVSPDFSGIAIAVNLVGTVVGQTGPLGVAWPAGGGIVDLGGVPMAINLFGWVAGSSVVDCCGLATHATVWRLGPGRGVSNPTFAGRSSSPMATTARVASAASSPGPMGCLSDAHAIMSKALLLDCVAKREK